MKNPKRLSGLLIAAAMAIPAAAMAQDEHRDEHHDDRRVEQNAHPAHDWHKGDRVPDSYRGDRYVVNDWKGHHLHEPPSGCHWVQVNGDFVLAAVATGVIADVLLNN